MLPNRMTRLPLLVAITLTCIGCSSKSPTTYDPTSDSPSVATLKEAPSPEPSTASDSRMPIYITPYYDSEGPQIDVGPFSEELAAATADSIANLSSKLKTEWATLPIETMYVASIRLYDLGEKNDAVYWFYSAQFRARLLQSVLPEDSVGGIGSEGVERIQAHNAFHQLAGEYINGYAFGELNNLQKTIQLVKAENETIPQLETIYPTLDLIDNGLWPEKNKDIAAGLDSLLDSIANNAEAIKAFRKENGIEGKY
jgi:hypothetical protein